ncbi:MAG: hypothetical protein WD009_06215 [Phycisphaeraceae bacterium]
MSTTAGTIRLICPNLKCRATLAVSEASRGKVVRCRQCQGRVGVPTKPERPVPAAPPEDAASSTS